MSRPLLRGALLDAVPAAGWLVLSLLWLVATGWVRPLMLPDEGRYVGVAWEMLRSGDWLTPTLNGLPFFHKPPLFYWITAGAMSVFGPHAWPARLAPLLGAWLGAAALFLFARRWAGERVARWALLALLSQPLWYIGGQFANLDMLVTGCITTTIVLLAHACLLCEAGAPCRRVLLAAWALAAVGVLAKGLIGAVIPALVVGGWLLARRRWRVLGAMLWPPAGLLFLALAAPWFVAMQERFPDFLDYFFVVQHFKRFAAGGFNNVQPVWFYPAVLLVAALPWWPFVWRGARVPPSSPAGLGPEVSPEVAPEGTIPPALRGLLVWWAVVVVGFFSMPQSKLVGYVLPALPPLAFLAAAGMADWAQRPAWVRRSWWLGLGLLALLSLGVVAGIAQRPLSAAQGMAAVLRSERRPDQPVLMLGRYDYDLGVHARLLDPSVVVEAWDDPDIPKRDNWRKEMADAGQFDPALAASLLKLPAALGPTLCAKPISWVVADQAVLKGYPALGLAKVAHSERGVLLLRVDTRDAAQFKALGCAGTPNAG